MMEQGFGLLVPVKDNFHTTAYKDILYNCPQAFGHIVYMLALVRVVLRKDIQVIVSLCYSARDNGVTQCKVILRPAY